MIAEPVRKWPRIIFEQLASGRLAVILLALLVALLLLGIFIPQWSEMDVNQRELWLRRHGLAAEASHALGLTEIRRSFWLWGASLLLFVNLSLCMIRRFPIVLASARLPARPPGCAALWPARPIPASTTDSEAIRATLSKRGYRTVSRGNIVYGLKGRFSAAGHWIFHLGLLVLLMGALLAAAAERPFRAAAVVGEGEPFDLHGSELLGSTEPILDSFAPLRFTLDEIDAFTEDLEVRRFDARLSAPDGSSVTVGINRPYRAAPYQMLAQGFGYMPGWVIVDERERMLRGAWLKMAPFPYGGEEIIRIGPRTSDVAVTFYPDHALENDEDLSQSYDLRNPRFKARLRLRGEVIFDGLLEPGQRIPLEEGRSFFFLEEIRMYGIFDIVRDQGYEMIFTGFGITTLGLFIRYGRIRKEIMVEMTPSTLRISGRSELLESLFEEEMDRLSSEMAGAIPEMSPQESKA